MPFWERLHHFLNGTTFKITSVVMVAINAYLIYCFGNENEKNFLIEVWGKAGTLLVNFSGTIVFLSVLIGGLLPILQSYLQRKKDSQNIINSFSLILLETIETVVEGKRKRFARAVNNLLQNSSTVPTCSKVFKTITKPDLQIEALLSALELFFKKKYPDIFFKIALMGIQNNTIKDWVHFLPYTARPNTDINDLKSEDSTISHALKTRRIVIVEDVQKELLRTDNKKYIKGSTQLDENWSQLCYPVKSITSNDVIFVICIGAKKSNFFQDNPKSITSYEWLLSFFSSRLALEHSLSELKDKAN